MVVDVLYLWRKHLYIVETFVIVSNIYYIIYFLCIFSYAHKVIFHFIDREDCEACTRNGKRFSFKSFYIRDITSKWLIKLPGAAYDGNVSYANRWLIVCRIRRCRYRSIDFQLWVRWWPNCGRSCHHDSIFRDN